MNWATPPSTTVSGTAKRRCPGTVAPWCLSGTTNSKPTHHLPSADAALRYDYQTGLLDTSYAAAWQLGRLLALQNTHFAKSLYRYRNQERRRAKTTLLEEGIERKYTLSATPVEEQIVETISRLPANA